MPYQTYQLEPMGATGTFAGGGADPIKLYGERATEQIMARIKRFPADQRAVALEVLLKKIDPTLPRRVESIERKLVAQGQHPDRAQHRAIAAALSDGIMAEMVRLGRGKGPKAAALLGLSAFEALGVVVRDRRQEQADQKAAQRKAAQYKYGRGTDADPWRFPPEMIAGTLRDHRIISLAPFQKARREAYARYGGLPFVGAQMQAGIKAGTVPFATFVVEESATVLGRPITRGQKYGIYYNEGAGTMALKKIPRKKRGTLAKLGGALKSIGKGIIALPKKLGELAVKAGEKLYDLGEGLVDKLGDLACGVVNHPAAGAAASAGAASQGAPPEAGAVGVDIAKGICGGADVPGVPPEGLLPGRGRVPGWVLPIGIGVGALALLLAFRRRK